MWKKLKDKFSKPVQPPKRPSEKEVDERALELVALGDKMFTAEDYRGARDAYESALRVDGHCADAWYRQGRYFLHEEELLQGMACLVRSLELNPKLKEAWRSMGESILKFIESDLEPLFIREHRIEIISEAGECFDNVLKLGGDSPKARHGRETCRKLLKEDSPHVATPRLFSFHSGGMLEKAKREVVSPYLKPGDYRRKTPPLPQND